MNSRFDSELDFQTAVFSFICPSSLNFLLYLGYKALCSMQVENLTVHRNALLIRSSLQKDMSLDSSNLSPISVSCIQWVPIQYCLSRKQACSLKEISLSFHLSVLWLVLQSVPGLTQLTLLGSLVVLQSHHGLTEWRRLEGTSGGHFVDTQQGPLESVAQDYVRQLLNISKDGDSN